MLFFLFHAAKKGYVIEPYQNAALGVVGKNASGASARIRLALRPKPSCGGARRPDAAEPAAVHEASHRDCCIANSVTTQVAIEPA
jgi:organic hydroperoxide reductase OsmC/OhrA